MTWKTMIVGFVHGRILPGESHTKDSARIVGKLLRIMRKVRLKGIVSWIFFFHRRLIQNLSESMMMMKFDRGMLIQNY